MPQLVNPYKDVEQHTVVSLEPYQMNSDIAINTKINLKNKVENKCNKYGFVAKVHKILERSDGNLPAENFSGNAIYNIKYHARVCIPVNNTYIIGKISVSNKKLIVATNGPIRIFMPRNNIDTNNFELRNNDLFHKKSNKILSIDMYVKVLILNHRISENSPEINSIGILYNIASESEVNKFYGSEISSSEDKKNNYISLSDEESDEESENNEETNFII